MPFINTTFVPGTIITSDWLNGVNDRLALSATPLEYGAVGDGVADDTEALADFFAFLAANPTYYGEIGDNYIYKLSAVSIPDNVKLRGTSRFRSDGTLTLEEVPITVGNNFTAEVLHLTCPGTEANRDLIKFTGDNVLINKLIVEADVERTLGGGVVCYGNTYQIDYFKSRLVSRPLQFQKPVIDAIPQTDIHIGDVDIYSYIRGIGMTNCQRWSIRKAFMRVRDSKALKDPGHNGILIQACQNFTIGDMYIANSGEHAFRIGGRAGWAFDTENFSVGNLTVVSSQGCALKINPNPEFTKNGSFASITAIDTGEGATTANNEVLRFTHANDIHVGKVSAFNSQYSNSCHRALMFNGCSNITIDSVHAENVSGRLLDIDETRDSGTANMNGLYINSFFGTLLAARDAFEFSYSSGGRTIGNIFVKDMVISGQTDYLYENIAAITTTGPISFVGWTSLATVNAVTPVLLDVTTPNSKRYVGVSNGLTLKEALTIGSLGTFEITGAPTYSGDLFINASATSTAGSGNYGASLALSRAESSRRGAAIATKQFGVNSYDVGISFLPSNSTGATNEAVLEKMFLKPTGVLQLTALPTYADNVAALAGGLVAGDLYKTAAGDLRITV